MILVVDDDPGNRMLLRAILEIEGHVVVEASNGFGALGMMGPDSLPDLVITDLSMPDLDGVELIERLRSQEATAAVPIIVVSGEYEIESVLETSGRIASVIKKPIDVQAFRDSVRAVVTRSPELGPLTQQPETNGAPVTSDGEWPTT
jgi:two-component system chemotaxis response regulator CheY